MIHGLIPDEFKKLVNQSATPHLNEVLLQIAAMMGPAD